MRGFFCPLQEAEEPEKLTPARRIRRSSVYLDGTLYDGSHSSVRSEQNFSQKDTEMGLKTIRVRAYVRWKNGRLEHVCAHLRSRPRSY